MNLRAKDLIIFSIPVLFFLIACKSKKNLGNDFIPDSEKLKVNTLSYPLELSTLKIDTIYSGFTSNTYSSYISSLIVGKLDYDVVENNISSVMKFNVIKNTIDQSAKFDSMVVSINRVANVLGDTTKDFTLQLYPSKSPIDTSKYYTLNDIEIEESPVGEVTFNPISLKSESDSLTPVKFHLNKTYSESIFNAYKNTSNISEFDKIAKGLIWKAKDPQNLMFLYPEYVSIKLFYSVDTISYSIDMGNFNPNDKSYSFSYLSYKNIFKGGISDIKNRETISSTNTDGKVYLQNYSSLNLKTKIPKLEGLVEDKENIIINKAIISLKSPKDLNTYVNNYYSTYDITAVYADSNNKTIKYNNYYNISNTSLSNSQIYTYYDETEQAYKFDVTDFVENLIDGKHSIRDIIFYTKSLTLIKVGDHSQNPNNFTLKVYYTKLK